MAGKTPVAPRTPELDALVTDYLDAKAHLEKHSINAKQLGEEIATRVGPGTQYLLMDGVGVTVTRPLASFDPALAQEQLTADELLSITEFLPSLAKAREVLTPEQLQAISVGVISAEKAKQFLSPARLAQVKKVGKPSVRVL